MSYYVIHYRKDPPLTVRGLGCLRGPFVTLAEARAEARYLNPRARRMRVPQTYLAVCERDLLRHGYSLNRELVGKPFRPGMGEGKAR